MERQRSSRLSWGAALLIVILVTALSFGGARLFASVRSGGEFGNYKILDLPDNHALQTVGNGFVYYDGSSLSRVDSDGETHWNYLVGANAQFNARTSGVAAWSGEMLTLIDWEKGTTLCSSPMEGEVLSARLGAKYAAVLLGPEHDSTIVLMEPGGRHVDSIALPGETVLDYGFFSDDSLFWVMALDTSGTVPTCEISTYKPGKMIVGSITDSEQLMYQVMFQSSQVCTAGVTHLKVYDYTGTEDKSKRRLVYGWYLVSTDNDSDDPMMAYVVSSQYDANGSMQDVRMIRSNLDQVVRMPFGCKALVAKGDRVYGFSNEGHIMVAQAGEQKVNAYPVNVPMERVYGVTEDGVAVVGYGTQIYLVNLP